MLTDRFDKALVYASRLHRDQRRKGTAIPYVSHLPSVAALCLERGGNEDQAIAALLHDAVEDQGGEPILQEIRQRFGDTVAQIVTDCTDAWPEPKPEWRQPKEAHISKLPEREVLSCFRSSVKLAGVGIALAGDRFRCRTSRARYGSVRRSQRYTDGISAGLQRKYALEPFGSNSIQEGQPNCGRSDGIAGASA